MFLYTHTTVYKTEVDYINLLDIHLRNFFMYIVTEIEVFIKVCDTFSSW